MWLTSARGPCSAQPVAATLRSSVAANGSSPRWLSLDPGAPCQRPLPAAVHTCPPSKLLTPERVVPILVFCHVHQHRRQANQRAVPQHQPDLRVAKGGRDHSGCGRVCVPAAGAQWHPGMEQEALCGRSPPSPARRTFQAEPLSCAGRLCTS